MPKGTLGVLEFGRRLIMTADLDPLYVALWKAEMPREQLCRWLLAYWCYYHAGLCSWISDQRDFYGTLLRVAKSGTDYPRGTERRHFRGALAIASVTSLRERGTAEEIVDWLAEGGASAEVIMRRVKELHGFGEWISWKVPDMLERLDLAEIEFREEDVYRMFKSSLDGAKEVFWQHSDADEATPPLVWAHRFLIEHLGALRAPPRNERTINVQETETVFCKWKSHLGGHYPLGKDSHELRLGCIAFGHSRTAQMLRKGLPTCAGGVGHGD